MKRLILVTLALITISFLVLASCSSPAPSSSPSKTTAPPATSAQPATSAPPATSAQPATSAPPATSASPTTAAKVFNLKFTCEQPPGGYLTVYGHIPFAQKVEQATNGRVKITIYDSSTLMKTQDAWEGIQSKNADLGWFTTAYFPGQFSYTDTLSLPFLFPNGTIGGKVAWTIYNKYPEIQSQWKKVKVLAMWTTEPYFLVSRKKFYKTMADFEGQKIRTTGGPPTDLIKALGGTPMLIGMPDLYMDLQKGVVDGALICAEPLLGNRLYENTPYYTYVPTVAPVHALIMNWDDWNSFPKDIQDTLTGMGEETSAMYGGVFDKARSDMVGTVKKAGFPINEYTLPAQEKQKWIDTAGKSVWNAWIKSVQGQGFTNAQQVLDDILATSAKFSNGN